jgi:hypothetical protein
MGILERIKEIEAEMARTQKNKATGFIVFYLPTMELMLISVCCFPSFLFLCGFTGTYH